MKQFLKIKAIRILTDKFASRLGGDNFLNNLLHGKKTGDVYLY
jgi:hypothetical protein